MSKTMKKLLPALLVGLFVLLPPPGQAQIVAYKAAALSGSWYAPDLGYYAEHEDYLLDFAGSGLTEVQLEFELLRFATLRASAGHWQQRSTSEIDLGDPDNARRHDATLRIVPITASLLYSPTGDGPRPVVGLGITQNLVQRSLERTRVNGSTRPEIFSGNGRDFTYHGLVGVHHPIGGRLWAGFESRYVWGAFVEEETPPEQVSLDGPQLGLSIRYHIR